MHPQRPLQTNHCAFEHGQQGKSKDECQWQPDGHMNPDGRLPELLNDEEGWYDDMSNGHNRQIGRCIIRALIMQIFATSWALVSHFEVFIKQTAMSTRRALAPETAQD